MENKFQNYTTVEEIERVNLERKHLEKRRKELKIIKDKLEEHFNFEIESYIIDDIVDNEEYRHFCLMVNLAVQNNKLTEKDGEVLKQGIKELFKIDGDYDRLNKTVIIGGFNYDEWYEKYHTEEIIDINKYLNKEDKTILKKLSIPVKNKILTNYEYDVLKGYVLEYYRNEEEMDKFDLSLSKPLDNTGVSREEYNKVLEKFENISNEYGTF